MVPDEVIWTVNWLHYLNYEPTARTSITCYLVRTRNDLGQTVTSYGWYNGIPRVVPFFRSFSDDSRLTVFLTEGKRVFHVSIFSLVRSGNSFASGRLSYGQAFMFHPRPTYYVTVLVCVCLYVCTTLTLFRWPLCREKFIHRSKASESRFCTTYLKGIVKPDIGSSKTTEQNDMDPCKHGLPLHLPVLTKI